MRLALLLKLGSKRQHDSSSVHSNACQQYRYLLRCKALASGSELVQASEPIFSNTYTLLRYNNSMKPLNSDPAQEAEQAGFDLNLIELNLSLTPTQRVEQHQSALNLVLELEAIRKARNENSQ